MIYLPKINFETFTFQDKEDGEWHDIFEIWGSFTNRFVLSTNLNVLIGEHWTCFGRNHFRESIYFKEYKFGIENEITRIRLSETYSFKWEKDDGEGLPKYMNRAYLEKSFKLKLRKEDLLNPELLRGFYSGECGFYAIIGVKNTLFHFENKIDNNFPEQWRRIKGRLLLEE